MQHRVRSKLRGLAWVFVAAVLLAGCSFDVSALPPQREQPASPVSHDDSGAAAPSSAGSLGSDSTDAGPTSPPSQPMGPEPPQTAEKRDAQVAPPPPDPVLDAGMNAAMDATVEPTPDAAMPDASVPDAAVPDAAMPDASDPDPPQCDPDLPCVCPHLLEQAVANGPCLCSLAQCAPDDNCRLLWFESTSYYFCDIEHTWDGADDHCNSVPNLHLASIESAAEDAFILANVSEKTWLGGNDREQEGRWVWPGGDRFYEEDQGALDNAYVNWHSTEPNNDGLSESAADCMLLWYEESVWADGSCGDEHGYVCEVER